MFYFTFYAPPAMNEKRILNCVIIDDDPDVFGTIKYFLRFSSKAVVVNCFERCSDFLEKLNEVSFDLAFLDCFFPNDIKNGADVAIKLKEMGKNFIFISAKHASFIAACRLIGPIDAMPKPLNEKRLKESVDTAFEIIFGPMSKKHVMMRVKEFHGEISICISDILYARPDQNDPRNKQIRMRNNINYTLMNYTFEGLLGLSSEFVMVNKSEMVSYEIVGGQNRDSVFLSQKENQKIPKAISLNPIFKDKFKSNFE